MNYESGVKHKKKSINMNYAHNGYQ